MIFWTHDLTAEIFYSSQEKSMKEIFSNREVSSDTDMPNFVDLMARPVPLEHQVHCP
jgi:hypothetical protein